jgi:flagellar basal-body rod protein FlgF
VAWRKTAGFLWHRACDGLSDLKEARMQNITTIALSRLAAQERAIEVAAVNMANTATPGFHAERMVFADWLVRQPGGGQPPGGNVISYTQDRATYRDTRQGPLTHTGNPLDIAIGAPDGYFTVQTPAGVRLTRAGHFELSAGGTIVDGSGNALLDTQGRPLQAAPSDSGFTITGDGTLSGDSGRIGRIAVVKPTDAQAMRPEGNRLFVADKPPTPIARPDIVQGAIEDSNVQPITEMTRMMTELRAYQFVSQFVQSEADREQTTIDKLTQKRP